MGKLLVTGADGFIGSRLCELLEQRGENVLRVVRTARKYPVGNAIALGNLEAVDIWSAVLDQVETVIHLGARAHVAENHGQRSLELFRAANVVGTMRLANAAANSQVSRLIYVSSIGVCGAATHGRPFTELDEPRPSGPYAVSKWEAEKKLAGLAASRALEVVVVRPALVYGPHAKGNLESLLKLVASGLPLPLGGLRNPRHFIGLDNLCDLLIHCISHPGAAGSLFLAAEPEPRSTAELVEVISRAMHGSARVWKCPAWLLSAGAALIGREGELRKMNVELQVDAGKAMRILEWRPPVPFEHEIYETVKAYVNTGHR
jgi:nucleoside-diphosphate-sugar epimerase